MAKRKKAPKTRWDGKDGSADQPRYEEDDSGEHTAGFLTPEEDFNDEYDLKPGSPGHVGGPRSPRDSGYYDNDYGSDEDYHMTASDYRKQNPRSKKPKGAETQELSAATAPQLHQAVEDIRGKMEDGTLYKGNVELAAILGSRPAQLALGRKPSAGMSANDLAEFLLTDPNLKIHIIV